LLHGIGASSSTPRQSPNMLAELKRQINQEEEHKEAKEEKEINSFDIADIQSKTKTDDKKDQIEEEH
jgi:hypothetical protein